MQSGRSPGGDESVTGVSGGEDRETEVAASERKKREVLRHREPRGLEAHKHGVSSETEGSGAGLACREQGRRRSVCH